MTAEHPPVDSITEHGYDWLVCARGHKWGSNSPNPSCPTCESDARFIAKGRTECEVEDCHSIVKCSDRLWDQGNRKCQVHWTEDGEDVAGPICIDELVTVFGEYNPRNTWNGWLVPKIDAWSVVRVMEAFGGPTEPAAPVDFDNLNVGDTMSASDVMGGGDDNYRYQWLDDGSLKLIDISQAEDGTVLHQFEPGCCDRPEDEHGEIYVEILTPNEDGLYALGAGSWVWSEDTEYGATDEWLEWNTDGWSVHSRANNAQNQRLIEQGVANSERLRLIREHADAEYALWLTDNPEPPKYPDGRTALPVPGQKEI